MNIYIVNIWIPLVLLLPNLFFIFFPSKNVLINNNRPSWWKIIIIFERFGQAGIFILPIFWQFNITNIIDKIALGVMAASIVIYYVCWIRFFSRGRKYILLYQKLMFVPIPMAIFPILYFLCISILLNSWIIAVFTLIFAIGHILETLKSIKNIDA